MATLPVPDFTVPDPTSDNARAEAWAMLTAKYADAGAWAVWGASTLEARLVELKNLLGTDVVGDKLAAVNSIIDSIVPYTTSGSFAYNAPAAPTYEEVPGYQTQTLGTILDIPTVESIVVPDAPSSEMVFTNETFSDSLADALRTKLTNDLQTGGTGLAGAEAGLFARAVQRENDILAEAYNNISSSLSSRGFDLPPGALAALQAQENNKSIIRLTDVNTEILAESAKLAQSWNQTTVTAATAFTELFSRIFDSKVMRDFEAAKQKVILSLEGFKQLVSVLITKADLNKTAITATVEANKGTVEVFKAEIEGQVAPMKAIADTNQAKASAYNAAIMGAKADLEAQTLPEELKLRGATANAQIAGVMSEVTIKEAELVIEAAMRQLQTEAATIAGLAQSAAQLVASAMNGVSASASFGFSGHQNQVLNTSV